MISFRISISVDIQIWNVYFIFSRTKILIPLVYFLPTHKHDYVLDFGLVKRKKLTTTIQIFSVIISVAF